MIGYHTNISSLKLSSSEYIYQFFLGSPYNYKCTKYIDEINDINNRKIKVYIHSKYMGNLLNSESNNLKIKSMKMEIDFIKQLKIKTGIVIHLQHNKTKSRLENLSIAKYELNKFDQKYIILENSDYNNFIGGEFNDLVYLSYTTKIGFCIDTCHLFVTGTDISNYKNIQSYFANFFVKVGKERLKLLHLNSTKFNIFSNQKPHLNIFSKQNKIFISKKHPNNLDFIKFLEQEMNLDIIFERGISDKPSAEVLKFKKYNITPYYNIIKNDFINVLIKKYFKFYYKNVYNQFEAKYFNNVYLYFKEQKFNIINKDNSVNIDFLNQIEKDFSIKIKNIVLYIIENYKDNKSGHNNVNGIYPKIPFLKEEEFKILRDNNFYTIEDLLNNIDKIQKLINNLPLFNYIKVFPLLTGIDKEAIKPLINKIYQKNSIEIVGSYSNPKKHKINDLDILVLNQKSNVLIKTLEKYGKILLFLKNGKKYKQFAYKYNDLYFLVDIFITENITKEKIIIYSLSKNENILLRKLAKSKGYKLNFDGLLDLKTNNYIQFENKATLFNFLINDKNGKETEETLC